MNTDYNNFNYWKDPIQSITPIQGALVSPNIQQSTPSLYPSILNGQVIENKNVQQASTSLNESGTRPLYPFISNGQVSENRLPQLDTSWWNDILSTADFKSGSGEGEVNNQNSDWISDLLSQTQTTWTNPNLNEMINSSLVNDTQMSQVTTGTQTGGDGSPAENMMLRMGYQPGQGLGKNLDGITEPIQSSGQTTTAGLGYVEDIAKTTSAVAPIVEEVGETAVSALSPETAFSGIIGNALNSFMSSARGSNINTSFENNMSNAHGLWQPAQYKADYAQQTNANGIRSSLGGVLSTLAGPLGALLAQSLPDNWLASNPGTGLPQEYQSQTSDETQEAAIPT